MSYIIICNAGSDTLSIFDIEKEKAYNVAVSREKKTTFGPHGMYVDKNNIILANSYNNTVSILKKRTFEEIEHIEVGPYPNDVTCVNGKIYVLCGEANCVQSYDMNREEIEYEVIVGNHPNQITLYNHKRNAIITNMGEESISLFDFFKNKLTDKINVGNSPVKSIISSNGQYVFIVISNFGYGSNGKILMLELSSMKKLREVSVGAGPVDIVEYEKKLYISNFLEGSISVVNLENFKEEKRIIIESSMPRGMVVNNNNIYCADYFCGRLYIIDALNNQKKSIAIGKEPNTMIFEEF